MDQDEWLTREFESYRGHLRAVAYRMLGSLAEADDAVQEAYVRLRRADTDDVENIGGWLTTVVARVRLNMLRSRRTRREDPLDPHVPDPIVSPVGGVAPEQEAVLADSVGLALLVVLEMLPPAERLAFVLHDMFAVPFDEIAPVVGRSTTATRQLASRARRRVQGAAPPPDSRPRTAAGGGRRLLRRGPRRGLRAARGRARPRHRPAVGSRGRAGCVPPRPRPPAVARQALMFAGPQRVTHPALVNGAAGVVVTVDGRPVAVMGFTVADGRIAEIDSLSDPARLAELDLEVLGLP